MTKDEYAQLLSEIRDEVDGLHRALARATQGLAELDDLTLSLFKPLVHGNGPSISEFLVWVRDAVASLWRRSGPE